jgi:coenzyme Q-binding protein COQ10
MTKIELQDILSVDRNRIFQTIAKYENYPKFLYGVKSVEVERTSASTARVSCHISFLKDIVYTLDLVEDQEHGTIRWSLVKSDLFKVNQGLWEIKDLGSGRSSVRYSLELEFKVPVPGIILKRLLKRKLSTIVKSFEKQAGEN